MIEDLKEAAMERPEHQPAGIVTRITRSSAGNISQKVAPFVVEHEFQCDECGGSGFDPGGIDPWGPEPCPVCRGKGTQRITKNYLAEALRIAANPECLLPVERAHLVAIVQYCRQAVSAVMGLPEVPEPARTQPVGKRSARHSRSRNAVRCSYSNQKEKEKW